MSSSNENSIKITDPFARRLLNQYLERRQNDLGRLRGALADKDFDVIERTGHNLFGSGAAYGLEPVSELGARLEKAAQKRDETEISQLVDALEQFVSQVTIST